MNNKLSPRVKVELLIEMSTSDHDNRPNEKIVTKICNCPQNVMKFVGILASNPIVVFESSESDDSDDSVSDEMVKSVVPKRPRRLRKKRLSG